MPRAVRSTPPPESISGHAADNLRFIRQAMERGSTFTAVPGMGGAAMGVTAGVAAWLGSRQPTGDRWLLVWLGAAAVAAALGSRHVTNEQQQQCMQQYRQYQDAEKLSL